MVTPESLLLEKDLRWDICRRYKKLGDVIFAWRESSPPKTLYLVWARHLWLWRYLKIIPCIRFQILANWAGDSFVSVKGVCVSSGFVRSATIVRLSTKATSDKRWPRLLWKRPWGDERDVAKLLQQNLPAGDWLEFEALNSHKQYLTILLLRKFWLRKYEKLSGGIADLNGLGLVPPKYSPGSFGNLCVRVGWRELETPFP